MTTCIECGSRARLTDGSEIYPHRPDLFDKSFWLCDCGAYCGCHPGTTTSLGTPAGEATRTARSAAHAAFDPLWKTGKMTRAQAYAWLAQQIDMPVRQCHIGLMTRAQAERAEAAALTHQGTPDWVKGLTA